ncbi:MAG: hypothetical protein GQ535_01440 [Rhodobacteraceae bacterium]|nr:hypothetical protein [Paracoccaceae bacterium]
MFPAFSQPGIFPEGRLHHLVLAACGSADPQSAWRAYADALGDGFPNEGELRVFPLVADRLGGDLSQQPLAKYLESARRWARMQAMLNQQLSGQIGALFQAEGIPLMWTKGAALVARTDQRPELRPSADIDALFRWEDVDRVLELGEAQGWKPRLGLMKNKARARYANTELSYNIGARGELDLQWRPRMAFTYDTQIQPWLWQDPTRAEDKTGTPYASDTWLLIEVLDHGLSANDVHPIRWVIDAVRLLEWRHASIDWEMFAEIVTRNKLHYSFYIGLQAVAKYSPHIPQTVLEQLQNTRVTYLDREELKARLSAQNLATVYNTQQALNRLRRAPSKMYYKSPVNPLLKGLDISVKTRFIIAARNVFTRIFFPLWYL